MWDVITHTQCGTATLRSQHSYALWYTTMTDGSGSIKCSLYDFYESLRGRQGQDSGENTNCNCELTRSDQAGELNRQGEKCKANGSMEREYGCKHDSIANLQIHMFVTIVLNALAASYSPFRLAIWIRNRVPVSRVQNWARKLLWGAHKTL